ncbi:MAG: GerMN domain-containing protein [Ilumatobacteraceae bacterium]
MRIRLLTLAGLIAVVPVACSVVDDGKVQRINPPDELTDTLPPTTIERTTTTLAATTTTGLESTTTEVQAEPVKMYFISSGKLSPVIGSLSSQYDLPRLIALLQKGPPEGELGVGLRSAVPAEMQIDAFQNGSGVAQVLLPDDFFDTIPAGDQRLAIAQIVMTVLDNTPGVGQVVFNLQVSGPAGELIPAGELLTRAEYEFLLASSTTPTTSTTTTTATAATEVVEQTTTTLPL